MVRDALASWDGPRDEVLIATKTGYRRTMEAPNVAENEPERQHLQAVGSQYGWMADSRPETMICDAKERPRTSAWRRWTCCTRTDRTRKWLMRTRSAR